MGSTDGKMDDIKGRVKQAAGDLAGDQDLKDKGTADRAAGGIKKKAGELEDKVERGVDNLKDKVTGKD